MGLFSLVEKIDTYFRDVSIREEVGEEDMRMANGTVISALVTRYIEIMQYAYPSPPSRRATVFDFPAGLQPSLSFRRFVHRFTKYTQGCNEAFLLAFYYIMRLVDSHKVYLDTSTCYRLFVGVFVVASKFLDDIPHSNRHIAKVSGLDVKEVNLLEMCTLRCLKFDLYVSPENPRWQVLTNMFHNVSSVSFLCTHSANPDVSPDEEAVSRAWYLDSTFKRVVPTPEEYDEDSAYVYEIVAPRRTPRTERRECITSEQVGRCAL